jgi:hypothetical protein
LKFSEYILAFSMLFPPVVDAIQGSMFNFQQSCVVLCSKRFSRSNRSSRSVEDSTASLT